MTMLTKTVLALLLAPPPASDGGVKIGDTPSADESGIARPGDTPPSTLDVRDVDIARQRLVEKTRSVADLDVRRAVDTSRVEKAKEDLKKAEEDLEKAGEDLTKAEEKWKKRDRPGSPRFEESLRKSYENAAKTVAESKTGLEAAERQLKGDTVLWEGETMALAAARARVREHNVRAYFTTNLNSLSVASAEAVLQVLGQVVVDKAVESGWQLLSKRLRTLAGCDIKPGDTSTGESGPKSGSTGAATDGSASKKEQPEGPYRPFLNTCLALNGDIHDLIAQPDLLVRAAVMDVLRLEPNDAEIFDVFSVDWKALESAWRADGSRGASAYLTIMFQAAVIKIYGEYETCPKSKPLPTIAAWMIGKCAVDPSCDINALAEECVPVESRSLVLSVLAVSGGGKEPRDGVNALFELARLGPKGQSPYLEHLQNLVVGFLDRDTTRAMSAAAELGILVLAEQRAKGVAKPAKSKKDGKEKARRETEADDNIRKFFEVMSAAARYAAVKGSDAEKMAARKEVVKELINRLARRSSRTSGWVVSLGGSFGGVGGARVSAGGPFKAGYASPMHVGLGVGVDSYHPNTKAGWHFEVSALDLGQYVVFTNKTLTVEKPNLKAAIAPSVKIGGHFWLKETPMYLAGFVGLTPFVHEKNTALERMTVSLGLIFGVYIPFIDFN